MDVFFGWGKHLRDGSSPAVAMNTRRQMFLTYIPSGHQLTVCQGTRKGATVEWASEEQTYADGREPSIALSAKNILTVHRAVKDDRLFYDLGTIDLGGKITWGAHGQYDEGIHPRIAINDAGTVLEVHHAQNKNRIWYNIGVIEKDKIRWNEKDNFADGGSPAVSMNSNGDAIIAYVNGDHIYYRLASTDGSSFTPHNQHQVANDAGSPSVAITDRDRDGDVWVILCYVKSGKLMQRAGKVMTDRTVALGDPTHYDEGTHVSVAAQAGFAVQVHEASEKLLEKTNKKMYFTTSLITDRSHWMANSPRLGVLPLRELILPASHDAAMYTTTPNNPVSDFYAETQDKNIHQQLTYGVRWFDLRVEYTKPIGATASGFYIHHSQIVGPPLSEVLSGIEKFQDDGSRELIILKFSHFGNFDVHKWNMMVTEINTSLDKWMFRGPLPEGKRLADLTLNRYAGSVLVVVDGDWAKDHPHPGYWIYRDASSAKAAEGDLRVYDRYSNADVYDTMKKNQILHFENYDGKCSDDAQSPCDLFLLSWTLTPTAKDTTSVRNLAREPDVELATEMANLRMPNKFGQIINMLYLDFTEYARPTDVALAAKDIKLVG